MSLFYEKDGEIHLHATLNKYIKGKDYSHISLHDCECDLIVVLKQVKMKYRIARRQGTIKRNITDMHYHACALICNDWNIMNANLIPRNSKLNTSSLLMQIKDMKGENIRTINPFFNTHRQQKNGSLRYDLYISHCYKAFDIYYLKKLTRMDISSDYLIKNVWLEMRDNCSDPYPIVGYDGSVGIPWEINKVDSLFNLSLRKLSAFNKVYGGFPDGNFHTVYTMNNLDRKILPALKKLKKPTHTMFGRGDYLSSYHFMTLSMMETLLDIKRFKGKRKFDIEREMEASREMSLNSSSGIRSSRDREI
jgi:hypothetical protein